MNTGYSKKRMLHIIKLFEVDGLSVHKTSKALHACKHSVRTALEKHYGKEVFVKMCKERHGYKWYNKKTLKKIVCLIDDGALSLLNIAHELRTHRTVLHRNMKRYYGAKEWEKIAAHYLSRRGIQKGTHVSPETEFKKNGPLRYINARRWRPIGAFQIKRTKLKGEGRGRAKIRAMRWIKVTDIPNSEHNWVKYSRWLWEQNYGHIPEGKCIVHLDDDTLNDTLENYACMTHVEYLNYLESRFPERLVRRKKRMSEGLRSFGAGRKRVAKVQRHFFECPSCGYEEPQKFAKCPKCGGAVCIEVKLKARIA